MTDATEILRVLDRCAEDCCFPMLDNGYVYLAAARLSLYRSATDWALVTEVFGFSPRAGLPDTHIQTFASRLHERDLPDRYVSREAYENYLRTHPNDESRFVHPLEAGPWIDEDEFVADGPARVGLRNRRLTLPARDEYGTVGIELQDPLRIHVFEFCRFLAATARDQVLATQEERRISVLPEMTQLVQLEDWYHPDLVNGEPPSSTASFQQLAQVLETGDPTFYKPTAPGNTHWRNWPEGGAL